MKQLAPFLCDWPPGRLLPCPAVLGDKAEGSGHWHEIPRGEDGGPQCQPIPAPPVGSLPLLAASTRSPSNCSPAQGGRGSPVGFVPCTQGWSPPSEDSKPTTLAGSFPELAVSSSSALTEGGTRDSLLSCRFFTAKWDTMHRWNCPNPDIPTARVDNTCVHRSHTGPRRSKLCGRCQKQRVRVL